MKIKFKRLISFLALTFCFCLVIGAGYTVARYAGEFDAGSFNLTLIKSETGLGEVYTLYYHTFDENRADIVYKTMTVYENESFVIDDAPDGANSGLTFLGWTPHGMWTTDENSLIKGSLDYESNSIYKKQARILKKPGDSVKVADLAPNATTHEIHLYDIYEELYVVAHCDSGGSNQQYQIFSYAHNISTPEANNYIFCRTYTVSGYLKESNGTISIALNKRSIKHYMHPGLYYRIGQNTYYDPSGGTPGEKRYYTDLYDATGTTDLTSSTNFISVLFTDTIEYILKTSTQTNVDTSCFASGTFITMADGSKLPVEEVKQGDMVRVFDHENGCYTTAPVLFTEYDGDAQWRVINLAFSDGTTQKFIYEHGLFDLNLNEYVYITEENCKDFIGHRFAKEEHAGYSEVVLTDAYTQMEFTGCYSLTTEYHLNLFVNGMFSMPGGITGLFNFFEYDENLAYGKELMAKDIETYGLFTYDDFAPYMSEETFSTIFPIKYLKVSIGKGLVTFEDLEYIIQRYIYRHDLDG